MFRETDYIRFDTSVFDIIKRRVRTRMGIWNNKTKLKGTKISIKEFLTKPRQGVFIAARKHFGINKCWTSGGIIIVLLSDGTRKKITSMSELQHLTAQHPQVQHI
ncbi:hypothetical protein ACJJTC_015199 [Scirpophaga incertulas]